MKFVASPMARRLKIEKDCDARELVQVTYRLRASDCFHVTSALRAQIFPVVGLIYTVKIFGLERSSLDFQNDLILILGLLNQVE